MLEKLRPWFKRLIAPIARALTRMGITANAVTVIRAVGTTIVGIASGITGWMFWELWYSPFWWCSIRLTVLWPQSPQEARNSGHSSTPHSTV